MIYHILYKRLKDAFENVVTSAELQDLSIRIRKRFFTSRETDIISPVRSDSGQDDKSNEIKLRNPAVNS